MTSAGRGDRPRRVRVTSPRRAARRRAPVRAPATEIEEETGLGELYVDTLLRVQLRLSLVVISGLVAVLGGTPLLLWAMPILYDLRLGPIPLVWLFLGALLYPFGIIVAHAYIRAAERVERDFTDLMRRS